jgi:MarR family transcriptional regulator, organic hydroperoxide resistance regulator
MTKKKARATAASKSAQLVRRSVQLMQADISQHDQGCSHRMREITKLFARPLLRRLNRHGVTFGEWRFLRVLWERDGVSQSELSDLLDMTSAATVFSVNLLERDGFAERVPDPTDRRRMLIYLTPKGRALRERLMPYARTIRLAAFAGFSDREVRQLDVMLDRIKSNLGNFIRVQEAVRARRR